MTFIHQYEKDMIRGYVNKDMIIEAYVETYLDGFVVHAVLAQVDVAVSPILLSSNEAHIWMIKLFN